MMLDAHYNYYKQNYEKSDMIMQAISRVPRDDKLQINFIDKVFLDILELQKNKKENMDDLKYQDLIEEWQKSNEKDLGVAYKLAEMYLANERNEQSIDLLIKIVEKEKTWEDHKAIKLLRQIFEQLGHSHN